MKILSRISSFSQLFPTGAIYQKMFAPGPLILRTHGANAEFTGANLREICALRPLISWLVTHVYTHSHSCTGMLNL